MTGPGEDGGFDSLWLEIEHDPFYSPAEFVLSLPLLIARGGSVFWPLQGEDSYKYNYS